MEAAKQVLGMGLLGWLAKSLLPEGECGRWGKRMVELVLLCEGVRLLLKGW